jgi:hypothetical protein
MVGPSLSEEEQSVARLRLKAGFVLLVGLSGGLVALGAGGDPWQLAVAVAGGSAVGLVLLFFMLRMARQLRESNRGPPR